MQLALTALVFVFASVTIAGSLLTVALVVPQLGWSDPQSIAWVLGSGVLIAVPASFLIARAMIGRKMVG